MNEHEGAGEIFVLGVIKGLKKNAAAVEKCFSMFGPDAVAVSISKEGMQAMCSHLADGGQMAEMDNLEEEYYVAALERFGEVSKPPPGFVAAWELANENDVPFYPVDFDDEEFTELYCSYVSGLEWLRQPARQRSIVKKRFRARTAEEFIMEWDELVNSGKGLRRMEAARERKIARETAIVAGKHARVLLIVDYERSDAVRLLLEAEGLITTVPES